MWTQNLIHFVTNCLLKQTKVLQIIPQLNELDVIKNFWNTAHYSLIYSVSSLGEILYYMRSHFQIIGSSSSFMIFNVLKLCLGVFC